MTTTITIWSHRCRTNVLFAAILLLGAYALVFDKHDDVTGICALNYAIVIPMLSRVDEQIFGICNFVLPTIEKLFSKGYNPT